MLLKLQSLSFIHYQYFSSSPNEKEISKLDWTVLSHKAPFLIQALRSHNHFDILHDNIIGKK